MEEIKNYLEKFDAIRIGEEGDSIVDRSIDRREPKYDERDLLSQLDPIIQKSVHELGINRLYYHQAEAIEKSLKGEDVILESPTASGKTLSFLIPMINKLTQDPISHALMIYPMKALAQDQRRQLRDFNHDTINSWIYDGDTDKEHRSLIKKHPPRILFTNPDTLHMSFLGWSNQWEEQFLRNLKFIVIDEIHEYRGYFGTNVGLLLRRLFHKLESLQSRPQLFLSTATCANPLEHANRLTGRNFSLISAHENGMKPRRNFLFINPNIPDYQFRDIFQLRITNAGLCCLSQNLSTLVFCPSRNFAEDAYRATIREADKWNINKEAVAPYRSGYRAEERREIENGLRNGTYKLVFSTNALELGIDIGQLDTIVLAGFPDNVMSAWQRIGRAGRSWDKDATIIFYAMNNVVDQFYASNIDAFLNKPLDEITIGISNDELIQRHIPYLLYESKWSLNDSDREILGDEFYTKAIEATKTTKPLKGIRGPNYQALNIRGGSDSIYSLIYNNNEIGSMSDIQVFREAYIGAIYKHFGRSYRVTGHGNKKVFLENAEHYLSSKPYFYTVVDIKDRYSGKRYSETVSMFYGKLMIFENFAGYKLIDMRNGNEVDEERSQNARRSEAEAFWLQIERSEFKEGIEALEHIFRIGSLFIIPADRFDSSTFSRVDEQEIYYYENYAGGIGLAEKAFQVCKEIIDEGIKITNSCQCKSGCPRCIYPPRLKDASSINKNEGIRLAEFILNVFEKNSIEVFNPTSYAWSKQN
jgi:DEAD/DEAH box helicase domain-containing protein